MSVMTVIEKRNVLPYLRRMSRGRNPVTLVISTRVDPTPTFCVWDLFSHHGPSKHTHPESVPHWCIGVSEVSRERDIKAHLV